MAKIYAPDYLLSILVAYPQCHSQSIVANTLYMKQTDVSSCLLQYHLSDSVVRQKLREGITPEEIHRKAVSDKDDVLPGLLRQSEVLNNNRDAWREIQSLCEEVTESAGGLIPLFNLLTDRLQQALAVKAAIEAKEAA